MARRYLHASVFVVLLICLGLTAFLVFAAIRTRVFTSPSTAHANGYTIDALRGNDLSERARTLVAILDVEKQKRNTNKALRSEHDELARAFRDASPRLTTYEAGLVLRIIREITPRSLDDSALICLEYLKHPFVDIQFDAIQSLDSLYTNGLYGLEQRAKMMAMIQDELFKYLIQVKTASTASASFNMMRHMAEKSPDKAIAVAQYWLRTFADTTLIFDALQIVEITRLVDEKTRELILRNLDPTTTHDLIIKVALRVLARCNVDLSKHSNALLVLLKHPSRQIILLVIQLIVQNESVYFRASDEMDLAALKEQFTDDSEIQTQVAQARNAIQSRSRLNP